MKTFRITVITLFTMVAFACDYQQNLTAEDDFAANIKPSSERSIIEKTDKTGQTALNSVELIVTEILITSPRFKYLTKGLYKELDEKGGLTYKVSLEGSPNPNQDKALSLSRTYDFKLYEIYADSQICTNHFTFNPNNRQLYEYDGVHNKVRQIIFDRDLLLKYDALCAR